MPASSVAQARALTRGEIVADGVVHAIGLGAAIVGAGVLIVWLAIPDGLEAVAAATVYGLGLIAMFAFSAIYNFSDNPGRGDIWRRLDHAAIFLMIAGTYTPFTTGPIDGGWAIGLTAGVWTLAGIGILLKLALAPAQSQLISTILYVAFGWVGIVAAGPFLSALSPTVVALLVAGGLVYTAGTIFFGLRRLPYQRAIWHGFVLAGAAIHFCAIWAVTA